MKITGYIQDATLSQGQPCDAPYVTSVRTNPNPATNLIPVHNLQ